MDRLEDSSSKLREDLTAARTANDAKTQHERAMTALEAKMSAERTARTQAEAKVAAAALEGLKAGRAAAPADSASPAVAATALAAEAERLSARMLQLYIWAEQREGMLRGAAQQQITTLRTRVEAQEAAGERHAQEARSWHDVAEALATEQRDAGLRRVLAQARVARLANALGEWRLTAAARRPSPAAELRAPSTPTAPAAWTPGTELDPISGMDLRTPDFDLGGALLPS